VNRVALAWVGFITVLFMLPPNGRTGITFGALLAALAAYHLLWSRARFRGPAGLRVAAEIDSSSASTS
jgi:hypothetical protein